MDFAAEDLLREPSLAGTDLLTAASSGGPVTRAFLAGLPDDFRHAEWRLEGQVRLWTKAGAEPHEIPPGCQRYYTRTIQKDGVVWSALVALVEPNKAMARALKQLQKVPGTGCC
jgi:hypothetical protein